jgi:A/G-specific adenine glycosylase
LKDTRSFRRLLLRWYRLHGRDLPWRQTRDPYVILVSEFMLQQTQVGTVLPYYNDWLRRFPDFGVLAAASEGDVLHAWQGLGYYARARNLHAAAKRVVDRHGGRFPRQISRIRELPGVGRYTANAIATFAFGQSVPVVEANTARLLARLFNITIPIDSSAGRDALWNRAAQLVPRRDAGVFNSALMDLGSTICTSRKPRCGICPVKNVCRSKKPEQLPIKKPRHAIVDLVESHEFIQHPGRVLLEQSRDRWRGMWILPQRNRQDRQVRTLHVSTFPFTHHRVTLQVFPARRRKIDKQKQRWFKIHALNSIPIPSPHRRAIEQLIAAT